MSVRRRVGVLGGLAAMVIVMSGCTVGYTADVRNTTTQPIQAALVRADGSGQPIVIASERLGPGNRAQVSRYNVPDGWMVYLEVDAMGNPGQARRMDLKPGTTTVKVSQDPPGPQGRLSIEPVLD